MCLVRFWIYPKCSSLALLIQIRQILTAMVFLDHSSIFHLRASRQALEVEETLQAPIFQIRRLEVGGCQRSQCGSKAVWGEQDRWPPSQERRDVLFLAHSGIAILPASTLETGMATEALHFLSRKVTATLCSEKESAFSP